MINGTYVCKVFHFKVFFSNNSRQQDHDLLRIKTLFQHTHLSATTNYINFITHIYGEVQWIANISPHWSNCSDIYIALSKNFYYFFLKRSDHTPRDLIAEICIETNVQKKARENLFYFACNLYVLSASMTQISSRSLSNYIRMRSIYIREILSRAYLHTISLHCSQQSFLALKSIKRMINCEHVVVLPFVTIFDCIFFRLIFCLPTIDFVKRVREREKYVKTIRANAHRSWLSISIVCLFTLLPLSCSLMCFKKTSRNIAQSMWARETVAKFCAFFCNSVNFTEHSNSARYKLHICYSFKLKYWEGNLTSWADIVGDDLILFYWNFIELYVNCAIIMG